MPNALALRKFFAVERDPHPHSRRISDSTLANEDLYNPRLDPANFLQGPLCSNPATCLKQPASTTRDCGKPFQTKVEPTSIHLGGSWDLRRYHCSIPGSGLQLLISKVRLLSLSIFQKFLPMATSSGAVTTASDPRLGQPDIANAKLNNFIEVNNQIFRIEA